MNPLQINGLVVVAVGMIVQIMQAREFGNHRIPQSSAEAICDLTCVIVVLVGVILTTVGNYLRDSKKTP